VEAAQSVSGPTISEISEYCAIAKANNMWLSLGGFKEKVLSYNLGRTLCYMISR